MMDDSAILRQLAPIQPFFDDDDIKDVMQTKEKGFWSIITSSGDLKETELDNDVIRIESLYKNNGFLEVKVSDAQVSFLEDSIAVSFKINEGGQYTTGSIDIEGDIQITEVPGGKYAITLHHGSYETLKDTYEELCGAWFADQGHEIKKGPAIELYLNDPRHTAAEDLLTEVWMPIK